MALATPPPGAGGQLELRLKQPPGKRRRSSVSTAVHKPDRRLDDPKEVLLGFLDYYRSVIARKIEGLTDAELRGSRLPSGWTPLELLKHLVYMERRWLRWGFCAEQIPDPRGDEDQAGRWHAGPGDTAADLIAALPAAGAGMDPRLRAAGVLPPRRTPRRCARADRRHNRRVTGCALPAGRNE